MASGSNPEENVMCAVCLDIFTDPVTLQSCCHSFCRECMESHRAATIPDPLCPVCRTPISEMNLWSDQHLRDMSENVREERMGSRVRRRAPENSCRGILQQREALCQGHQKILELFCQTDLVLACWSCVEAVEHRGHTLEVVEDAAERHKVEVHSSLDIVMDTTKVMEKRCEEQEAICNNLRIWNCRRILEDERKTLRMMKKELEEQRVRVKTLLTGMEISEPRSFLQTPAYSPQDTQRGREAWGSSTGSAIYTALLVQLGLRTLLRSPTE